MNFEGALHVICKFQHFKCMDLLLLCFTLLYTEPVWVSDLGFFLTFEYISEFVNRIIKSLAAGLHYMMFSSIWEKMTSS